jgi:hypothetical protein
MIVVVVTGSRSIRAYSTIKEIFNRVDRAHKGEDIILINGGAQGVDKDAQVAAASLDWYVETYHPDWRPNGIYDKAAGHHRNRHMVAVAQAKQADQVYGIGFMDPAHQTPGTKGMIQEMRKAPFLKLAVYGPNGKRWM